MTRDPEPSDWVWIFAGEEPLPLTADAYEEAASIVALVRPPGTAGARHGHAVARVAMMLEASGDLRREQRGAWEVLASAPRRQRAKRTPRKRGETGAPLTLALGDGGASD